MDKKATDSSCGIIKLHLITPEIETNLQIEVYNWHLL